MVAPPLPPLALHPLPFDAESDFLRHSPSAARAQAQAQALRGVGGVVLATTAVGFVEACLLFERRPIPLRFAARYALANVLPSAVWASAPAEWVATASGVPASALLLPPTPAAATASSAARAKRLLALKTARCVRQTIGSYALAWSLWRLYAASERCDETSASTADAEPADGVEKVVRLAPADSQLSRATAKKHGEHVMTLPLSSSIAARKSHANALAIDWETQGLERRSYPHCRVCSQEPPAPLKLLEVELQSDADSLRNARRLVRKALYDLADGGELCTVAVLPAHPIAPLSALDAFDVCVSPLAAVLCALASAFELQEAQQAVLLCATASAPAAAAADSSNTKSGEEEQEQSHAPPLALSDDLAKGLLYQHGVKTTAMTVDEALPDAETEKQEKSGYSSQFVIVAAHRVADGKALARRLIESGFVASESVFVVCEESVAATSAGSRLLELLRVPARIVRGSDADAAGLAASQVLSLADTGDALLQRVREALRAGHSSAAVQRALYRTYGPQKTLQRRRDALSDVGKAFISYTAT